MSQIWKTKDGQEIPITQMTDEHLANSIVLLCRIAENAVQSELKAAVWATGFLQGDIAKFQAEQDCLQLYEIANNEAEEMFPKFKMLVDELERRELAASGLI